MVAAAGRTALEKCEKHLVLTTYRSTILQGWCCLAHWAVIGESRIRLMAVDCLYCLRLVHWYLCLRDRCTEHFGARRGLIVVGKRFLGTLPVVLNSTGVILILYVDVDVDVEAVVPEGGS